MRLLDDGRDVSLAGVTVFLTRDEAGEFYDKLELALSRSNDSGQHFHVADYSVDEGGESGIEVTIVLYDPEEVDSLPERGRRLIMRNE